jgi:hypothetical protein
VPAVGKNKRKNKNGYSSRRRYTDRLLEKKRAQPGRLLAPGRRDSSSYLLAMSLRSAWMPWHSLS